MLTCTNNTPFVICILVISLAITHTATEKGPLVKEEKYILYDVNPGEGFNLRRDVLMRIAVLVRMLNQEYPGIRWTLVLPPWGHLYHWQTRDLGAQIQIPWSLFFDVESINKFVPVMELSDFLSRKGRILNAVFFLQGYKGGWKHGQFEEKYEVADCLDRPRYTKDVEGYFNGQFWHFASIKAEHFFCLSVQGRASTLGEFLSELPYQSIMLDRAENLLHDSFGDINYWGVRRAMKFAPHLVKIADNFRADELSSNDKDDDTLVHEDWTQHRAARRVRGGPYMAVHLRRKDYVASRAGQIPSIKGAAEQLIKKLEQKQLKTLYVATDAPVAEFEELKSYMPDYTVVKYTPDSETLSLYKDGGIAIIDQLIASHAKYFLGSFESTFSFRIQEEREIMGFPATTTFDMLCPDGEEDCEKGSKWLIEWGPPERDWDLFSQRKGKTKNVEL